MGSLTLAASGFYLPPPDTLGIVVARFTESLAPWVPVSPNTYVYDKGYIPQSQDNVSYTIFREYDLLPNIGREGHTHLHHIVTHWDRLEDYMIFAQAAPFSDLLAPVVTTVDEMVNIALDVPLNDSSPFNPLLWRTVNDWGRIDWNSSREQFWVTSSILDSLTMDPLTAGQYWRRFFGNLHPACIGAMHGGTFAVRRDTIKSLPKKVYMDALEVFIKANATDPEFGLYMERFWAPFFSSRFQLPSCPPDAE